MLFTSHRVPTRVSIFIITLALALMPNLVGKHLPVSVTGSVASAQTGKSYDQFITSAYIGALGRLPTCFERQTEYDNLVNASAAGALRQEAERFVSTLFETAESFADSGGTYCQTPSYEARNPAASCNPFVNTRSDEFITDLYHAFLQRDPETGGFNNWMATISGSGRKVVLNGFRFSVEFGTLVNSLYAGTRPCEPDPDPTPDPCPDTGTKGGWGQICP